MRMDKQELFDRIKVMEEEELKIVVKAIPSADMLINEYIRRAKFNESTVNEVRRAVKIRVDDYGIKSKGSDEQSEEKQDDRGRMGTCD